MPETTHNRQIIRALDIAFVLGGIVILIIFTTVYQMPFRLDDVLHMDWARDHSFWDAFDVGRGEIVRSVRPVFAMTIWLLTHTAGIDHYFPWHFVLVGSFLIGLGYAGKTARYIARDASALYFTTGFFWLVFLPILNVLFWYGDLTFTIELMFVAPAWYYGLRGMLEGRIGLWIIAILSAILAVLAKEPAILLVHSVFVGTFVLFFGEIRNAWRKNSKFSNSAAIILYVLFLVISIKLYFASPTRSNRFFNIGALSRDQLIFFVDDRLRYYAEVLLNPISRILLGVPLIYMIIRGVIRKKSTLFLSFSTLLVSALLAFFALKSLILFSAVLLLAPLLGMIREKNNRSDKLVLLYSISATIIIAFLLITVMLVKTQLTELSFVLLIISGVYWTQVVNELNSVARPYLQSKRVKYAVVGLTSFGVLIILFAAFPTMRAKEKLLRNVRDVRTNANDAIKWMGANLPTGSMVLVTSPTLYGLGSADDMTSKDDEYKLYAQYTFLQGYIRSYFRALNRTDIGLGYLEDSLKLRGVLDSWREDEKSYLFLQTGLDVDRFHGSINCTMQLRGKDSLLAKFSAGPYPSEVWKLGR